MRSEPADHSGDAEVRAAGGLVHRRHPRSGESEVVIVHRPRHRDWSLPKGKLEPGESWEQAALREVAEEAGVRGELLDELEPARYRDRHGRRKLVRFWLMRPIGEAPRKGDEVDEVRWLPAAEAERLLSYDHDRRLVRTLR